VAFPTDTVYGVGAHAFQPQMVERIYAAKIRPRDNAIPLLLAAPENLSLVAESIPPVAHPLADFEVFANERGSGGAEPRSGWGI
jgi:L-threonylcarbamoyladenylate synthase